MMFELKNALLIHNPNAGGGGNGRRRTLDAARHIFAAGGIHSDLAETTGPGHATDIASRAAGEGRGLVIACGGGGPLGEKGNGRAPPPKRPRFPPSLLSGAHPEIVAPKVGPPPRHPRDSPELAHDSPT